MKRLTITVAALALLVGCSNTPSGPSQDTNVLADGSLALKIGPEADTILNVDPATNLSAVVASAWTDQQGCDVECEVDYAAVIVTERNPEVIEVTQTRLAPASEAKSIPSSMEYPEFAPMLEELLQSMGYDYKICDSRVTISTTVPMLLYDGSDIDMRFTVTETIISLSSWVP